MQVTETRSYEASCLLSIGSENVCFQAGPKLLGRPSYRLEFNPAKIALVSGLDDLMTFLCSVIDYDPLEFFQNGKITRCDVALDFPNLHLEGVILRALGFRKHAIYSNQQGYVQTSYVGTPKSPRTVAYQKPLGGSMGTGLRLERRLKPGCLGQEVASLKNPFHRILLIPANFSEGLDFGIPAELLADSVRIGGIKRPMRMLDPARRKKLKLAFEKTVSLMPNLDHLWTTWPATLIGLGLGYELGALPMIKPGEDIAA